MTPRERVLFYWLLRAYQAHHREGWETGPSAEETFDELNDFLFNHGMDPNLHDAAKKLVEEQPVFALPTSAPTVTEGRRCDCGWLFPSDVQIVGVKRIAGEPLLELTCPQCSAAYRMSARPEDGGN